MRSFFIFFLTTCLTLFPHPLHGGVPYTGSISPGFEGSQMNYINNNGIFLESNSSAFGFGFITTPASVTLFTLSIVHKPTSRLIWSANRASPVSNSDKLQFQSNGAIVLRREEGGEAEVWRLDNANKNASRMELRDSGNLVVVSGDDGASIWESFDHPTDTLITNQAFKENMKLTSNPSSSNMTYSLEIKSGDMLLSVDSSTPQTYWSMGNDRGRIIEKNGVVTSSSLLGISWRFFDEKQSLLWQFVYSDNKDDNATWIAVLGNNGVISFSNLGSGVSAADSSTKIPSDQCSTPEPCGSYYSCSGSKVCGCVSGLSRVRSDCKSGIDTSPCDNKKDNNASSPVELVNAGDGVDYFALGFASPFSKKVSLDSCKEFCSTNCSCLGLFFRNSSGDCFLFDWIGSFKSSGSGGSGLVSFIKVATNGLGGGDNGDDGDGTHFPYIVIIVLATVFIIGCLIFVAFRIHRRTRTKTVLDGDEEHSSEEDNFLENLSGMPIRFTFKDLQSATNNFSIKLGQGGFGSVYEGTLPDGSRLAVKKLEGIGQGKKEFRAEVSIIGSIHHLHLVRLRGFCAEGAHRLLVYEFLAKGSLEKWIFRRRDGDILLDWDTRFNIAVGTAKGLAYLHEDCDARIIHCDIKPENILLDDNFNAKLWMVLLELIGGRKNYDPSESSEKCHFPSYAFKMMEEGKLLEIVDGKMKNVDVDDERVQRAMKTALWCIQEDMHLRPSMSKVVQMLEGVFHVVQPPSSSTLGSRLYSSFCKSISEEGGGFFHINKQKKKKQEKQEAMRMFFSVLLASLLIFFPHPLHAGVPYTGSISPGFEGAQVNYISNGGIFLESINKDFGFGFITTPDDVTLFTLSIIHKSSSRLIWSANRASPVSNYDKLQFQANGAIVLRREEGGGSEVWRLDNANKNASRMELRDSGNLVVVSGDDGASIWESFDHPTDTLITNQVFKQGMKLTSNASYSSNMTYSLEIKSGDMFLSVNSLTPQVYWSMGNDRGRIVDKDGGVVTSSSLLRNSWMFFDDKQSLLWQFLISHNRDDNSTWIAVLGNNGVISFTILGSGEFAADSLTKIPTDKCATPEPCSPYYLCSVRKVCQCVSGLSSAQSDCKTGITSPCKKTNNNATLSVKLVNAGDSVDYFALGFASPFTNNTNLDSCKEFCNSNCSCLGLFFQNSSGDCFLFDWIGSFKSIASGGSGFISYIKVATNDSGVENKRDDDGKHFPYIVIIIVFVAIFIICLLIFAFCRIHRRTKARLLASQETTHSFVNILPGTSIQFSYKDLQSATNNFSVKLGQGGFGSVFKGTLPDGSHIAVKQLEGIGQGKKEFKAEVSTIGSIHHQNLVHLTGFCEEGAHRLLVYEYLAKGSLERWIFKRRDGDILLDWDTRFNIAVGTAKGLAYLHEDCDARIIHCDIKPQNILLDDDFNAKVSDFGLAKLMTREQSHVFTTLRGTRGYMAPEWITTYAISEKSDVYSYGMVLVELIRRRKNKESLLASASFPAYAFKRMREGLLIENVDWDMEEGEGVDVMNDERVQRAMKTAFWCIQEDMHLRPSMSKVVQMLEGVFPVLQPPYYTRLELRSINEEGGGGISSSISHSQLSGPR
uniref:non-specific serine/threonine protein kinase n=1 Tax=Brassica campestris TaxID=3711 RepID=M4D4D3_BRACM